MSAIADRYDRDARLYERWWAPVLAPAAAKLLDRSESAVAAVIAARGTARILDIGTGTGALAIDAAGRWPEAEIVATDAARGMLVVAKDRAEAAGVAERIRWEAAPADALGEADASIDLVVSSFVFQLVPDRAAVHREVLRVLRPGGRMHLVSWLTGREAFPPADEFDEAVYDLDIEEAELPEAKRAGDFRSPSAVLREWRRAGFRGVTAEIDRLDQRWTARSYLDYKLHYDESGLVHDIGPDMTERLRRRAEQRLAALDAESFRWRPPILFVQGRRPGS